MCFDYMLISFDVLRFVVVVELLRLPTSLCNLSEVRRCCMSVFHYFDCVIDSCVSFYEVINFISIVCALDAWLDWGAVRQVYMGGHSLDYMRPRILHFVPTLRPSFFDPPLQLVLFFNFAIRP